MSVPFEVIECERCGYAASTLVTAGKFVWSDGGEEYWFGRKLGICTDCECVVAMEEFPDEERLIEQERRSRMLEERRKRKPGFFGKIFNRPLIDPSAFGKSSDDVSVARKVLELKRRPVCLSCGSTRVAPLMRPENSDSQNTSLQALGFLHPGCGGMLTIYGSGDYREEPAHITLIYDIQGKKIGERLEW